LNYTVNDYGFVEIKKYNAEVFAELDHLLPYRVKLNLQSELFIKENTIWRRNYIAFDIKKFTHWAKSNISGIWVHRGYIDDFYLCFSERNDALLTKLAWGG
jgi:hypothetical protein